MNKKQREWFENYFKPKHLKTNKPKGVLKNQINCDEIVLCINWETREQYHTIGKIGGNYDNKNLRN